MKSHINHDSIFEKIAAAHHVTVEEVRREIELAMQSGLESPDPEVQKNWETVKKSGQKPTPDEFIEEIAQRVKNQM